MSVETLDNTRLSGRVAVDSLVGEVGNWEGVEVAPEPRFGAPAFYVGRRQLGHLHDAGERGAFADIPLPRVVRDELIAAGRARPHSAVPDSGWLTVPVRTASDLAGAVEVFRLAYERAGRCSCMRPSTTRSPSTSTSGRRSRGGTRWTTTSRRSRSPVTRRARPP